MTGILVKVDAGQLPESIAAEIQARLNYLLRPTQPGAKDDSCRAGRPGQGATPQPRERRRTLGSSGAGSVCCHTSGNAP